MPAAPEAFAAGSVTQTDYLRNTNWGVNHFRNLHAGIHRPDSATAADNWRWAGDLTTSTGLLAHTGANYADTTVTSETVNIIYYGVRWEDIDDAISRVLDYHGEAALGTEAATTTKDAKWFVPQVKIELLRARRALIPNASDLLATAIREYQYAFGKPGGAEIDDRYGAA